jgi:D-alanyl-lipoteichoic acid acyltransferase DltB (MBOAT superfamily)
MINAVLETRLYFHIICSFYCYAILDHDHANVCVVYVTIFFTCDHSAWQGANNTCLNLVHSVIDYTCLVLFSGDQLTKQVS